ncbi:MAG: arsenate reductase ArsC [Acidobacteriota bacterium]|nr:arsenate reductase ArsC [Acidobacteriota bacterium]
MPDRHRQGQQSSGDEATSAALAMVVERLSTRYRGVFSRETVARAVYDGRDRLLAQATVISPFMPTLIERFAGDQLRAAALVRGLIAKELPEVLFVCEHNAGRSQMAAALAHQLGAGRVEVRSAGSHPRDQIFAVVVEAMREIGLDVTREFPKPLTDVAVRAADVVITMGCGEACPVYPGKRYEDWQVADPAGQPLEAVRGIRDEIRGHVEQLLASLPAHPRASVGTAP